MNRVKNIIKTRIAVNKIIDFLCIIIATRKDSRKLLLKNTL